MKNKFVFILLLTVILVLSGCSETLETETPVSSSSLNNLFELSITADNSEYKSDMPITCYATLKYIGTETITVYHGQPLLSFGIKDGKYFDNGYIVVEVLISTTFNPGDEIIYEFKKSGGWSQDEPYADFYEEFYTQKELFLPKGDYILSANIKYSLDKNDVLGTLNQLSTAIEIKVRRYRSILLCSIFADIYCCQR